MARKSPAPGADRGQGPRRRRGILGGATLVVAALLFVACSPEEVAEAPDPAPTTTLEASRTTTTVTTPPTVPTTTTISAPIVAAIGPKEFNLLWECDEVEGRGFGDLTFTCSAGRQLAIPEFHEGYFNGAANFDYNEQNEIVGISFSASSYNGDCMWLPEAGALDAPVEDGKAVIEGGVLIGTGRCEGLRLAFQITWDEETLAFDMDGVVELIGE